MNFYKVIRRSCQLKAWLLFSCTVQEYNAESTLVIFGYVLKCSRIHLLWYRPWILNCSLCTLDPTTSGWLSCDSINLHGSTITIVTKVSQYRYAAVTDVSSVLCAIKFYAYMPNIRLGNIIYNLNFATILLQFLSLIQTLPAQIE